MPFHGSASADAELHNPRGVDAVPLDLTDNSATAYRMRIDDGSTYPSVMAVQTTTGSVVLSLGNPTTNPAIVASTGGLTVDVPQSTSAAVLVRRGVNDPILQIDTAASSSPHNIRVREGYVTWDEIPSEPTAVADRVHVYAYDNAGTVELRARTTAGTVNLLDVGTSLTGTHHLSWTVNEDATAAADADPFARLLGGDGVAAPNDDLIRSTLTQDSSAETLTLITERSRNGGAFAEVPTILRIGSNLAAANGFPRLEFNGAGSNQTVAIQAGTINASAVRSVAIGINSAISSNDTVAIGSSSSASGVRATALGYTSLAGGNSSVSLGSQSNANGAQGIAIGANASAGTTDAISIGNAAVSITNNYTISIGSSVSASGVGAIAIGRVATSTNASTIAIGLSADATASKAIAIGDSTNASGSSSIAIGDAASASAANSIAFGQSTSVGHANSIAIGRSAASTATNQFVVGSASYATTEFFLGRGVTSATSGTTTISATGGTGTDIAGHGLVIAGGRSTGNAKPGDVVIQNSARTTSGTTLQTSFDSAAWQHNNSAISHTTSAGLIGHYRRSENLSDAANWSWHVRSEKESNTPFDLWTLDLGTFPSGSVIGAGCAMVWAQIVAVGVDGIIRESALYSRRARIETTGASISIIDTGNAQHVGSDLEDVASWDCEFIVSGNSLKLSCTGDADFTVAWHADIWFSHVTDA